MDIRAKKSGVFVEGMVAAQGEISVGSPLYKLDTTAGATASAPKAAAAATPPAQSASKAPAAPASKGAPMSIPVPIMGESITTGMLSEWSVKEGDFVSADQVVAIIETDKVTYDSLSPPQQHTL
jgi:pyruvate/2-oxoglutarate dehydrogenase complex dihydrolipoamide acyltransferase (E2) component